MIGTLKIILPNEKVFSGRATAQRILRGFDALARGH